jgi:hypothetical protein
MKPYQDGPLWRGLELREHQESAPGYLRRALNVSPRPDGRLGVRPGFRGMLSAVLPGPVVASFEFLGASGSFMLLAVGGAEDGKIYRLELSGTSATLLSGSTFFDAATVQFARLGPWVFISGAIDGKLYRYNGTTFEAATGLPRPSYSIASSVVSRGVIFDPVNTARWRSRWVSSAGNQIAITERNFPLGSSFWNYSAGATPGNVSDGNGEACVELDGGSAPEWVESDAISIPGTVAGFLLGSSSSDGGKAWAAALEWSASAEDVGSIYPAGWGQVSAYSDAGGSVAIGGGARRVDHVLLAENAEVRHRALWDGRALSSLNTLRARWQYDYATGSRGVDVNRVSLHVYEGRFSVSAVSVPGAETGVVEVRQGTHAAEGGAVLVNGQWLEYSFASAVAWSSSRAVLRLDLPSEVGSCLLKVSVSDGTTAAEVATLLVETGTLRYSLDLSKVAPAILGAITSVRFTFLSDLVISGVVDSSNAPLLRIGGIVDAGGLAVGKSGYQYCIVESKSGLTSPSSVVTVPIIPTQDLSTGKLVLSAVPETVGASLLVYKRGGTLGADGQWRLLASFSPAADTSGLGWSWDVSDRQFLDFSSDAALVNADFLYDHASPPTNVRALAVYGRRLACLTDTELWLSRQESGAAAGLYYDTVNDPGAANVREQGAVFRSADASGLVSGTGAALRLVAFDNRLFAFFASAVLVLSGQDAANFALRSLETGTGGLLGRRAVCVHLKKLHWVSAVGLVALSSGGAVEFLGAEIAAETGIGGEADSDVGMVAALAAGALWSADSRLFWSLPSTATEGGAGVFVLSSAGWYRWGGFGVVNGGQTISQRRGFWALGSGGQVFRVDAAVFGDAALSGSGVIPVQVVLWSSLHGGENALVKRCLFGTLSLEASVLTPVVLDAWGDNGLWAGSTWRAQAGVVENAQKLRFTRVIKSDRFYWRFTAVCSADLRIRTIGIIAADGGIV